MRRRNRLRPLVLLTLLGALPAAAERPRLVVIGIESSSDALRKDADLIAEQVLTELGRTGLLDAMGTSDVSAALGIERQRQLLGCDESSTSCLAEISNALGAPWLVTGSLGRLGKTMRLDLKLIRAKDGKAVFRDGKSITDESEVFDVVTGMVKRMVASLGLEKAPGAAAAGLEASPPGSPSGLQRAAPWVVAGAGVVAIVAGGLVASSGWSLRSNTLGTIGTANTPLPENQVVPTYDEARAALNDANRLLWVGGAVAAAGVLAAGGGLAWKLGSSGGEPKAEVAVGPGAILVRGEF